MISVMRIVVGLVTDALGLGFLLLHLASAIRAENLVLRKQLVDLAELARMAFAVKEDELPDPESIGLFGARAQVPAAADGMNLIHQAKRGSGIGLRRLVDQTP